MSTFDSLVLIDFASNRQHVNYIGLFVIEPSQLSWFVIRVVGGGGEGGYVGRIGLMGAWPWLGWGSWVSVVL